MSTFSYKLFHESRPLYATIGVYLSIIAAGMSYAAVIAFLRGAIGSDIVAPFLFGIFPGVWLWVRWGDVSPFSSLD